MKLKLIFIILLMSAICYSQKFEAENMVIVDGGPGLIDGSQVTMFTPATIGQTVDLIGDIDIIIRCVGGLGQEKIEIIGPDFVDTVLVANTVYDNIKIKKTVNQKGDYYFSFIEDVPWNKFIRIDYVEFKITEEQHENKYDIVVVWQENTENDIAGYKLFYGLESGNYIFEIDVKLVTQCNLQLSCGFTYFFALKAYDTSGNESQFSDEVAFYVECDSNISQLKPIILQIINQGVSNE